MSESPPERPTFWIVLSVVLLLVAVGLGVWAITAERAKDDAQQELASLQKVAAQAQDKTTAAEQARSASSPTRTSSPACSCRPRRLSSSPLTRTSVEASSSFASPPVPTTPASLSSSPSRIISPRIRISLTATCPPR